jgi:3-oxoacyl-[acyl-carrier protein] reductase
LNRHLAFRRQIAPMTAALLQVDNNAPERVALITGASGGLGQALVREFVAQGWGVVATSRNKPSGEKSNPWHLRLDVTKKQEAEAVIAEILKRFNRIDALVNNAGLLADAPLSHMDDVQWENVLSINLKGVFLASQAVLRPMLRQRSGHIINIGSFAARGGGRGQVNYAAAKAGLFGLTTSLAREVGSRNIRVNTVLPGVLPTRMTSHLSPAQLDAFARANALGRINSLAEVARFVAFLATTQNISGQMFQLDSRIAPWT